MTFALLHKCKLHRYTEIRLTIRLKTFNQVFVKKILNVNCYEKKTVIFEMKRFNKIIYFGSVTPLENPTIPINQQIFDHIGLKSLIPRQQSQFTLFSKSP